MTVSAAFFSKFRRSNRNPGKAAARSTDELSFLPAALQIVESPPSPIGRAISVTIIIAFCLVLIWASIGTVDIVATAQGKIIPTGRTKTIQPFENGIVREIHVREGQFVHAGDVLVDLDPTMSHAELEHLKSGLLAAEMDVARLKAALADTADPLDAFLPPAEATPALVKTYGRFLVSQAAEQRAKIASIDGKQMQRKAELATVEATVKKLQATIPILQDRVDVRKNLYDRELGSKLLYLSDLQDLVGQRQDLLVEQSKIHEAEAAIAELEETKQEAVAEYRRSLFDDLVKAEQTVAESTQDVIKAKERTKLQRLTAPVDGIIQELSIHTVGGVVTTAQPLLVLVPFDSHLEIEAMVSNQDIGFVQEGQDAQIKIDTFNFTRYGLLNGKVLSVSPDAISRTKADAKGLDRKLPDTMSGDVKDQDLIYLARVSLDRTKMRVEDKMVNLSPGMAVTVEIKTGSRRIISYLLSPLFRIKQESLRER